MSHYKPYPEYRDSKVEWLGQVPAHWDVKALKYLATPIIGLTYSPEDVVEEGVGTLVLRSSNIQGGKIVFEDNVYVSTAIPEQLRTRVGDIVICSRNGSKDLIGKNGMVEESSAGQTFGAFTTVVRSTINDYLYFVLNSSLFKYQSSRFLTTTINQLTTETLKSFELPLPPQNEQTRIVAFLKLETVRIDDLVGKKTRFIELLREKRQALITHAVTKGLDPNVPMKNSGVKWLGEVPEHWTVLSFQRRVYIAEGQVNPEEQPYSDMTLIAPNHIESGTGRLLYTETAAEQMAESGKYLCREGDVIYSKIRPALRKACIAPADCLCSADMYPLRGDEYLLNHYLLWFLLSEPFSAFAVLEADRVAMPKINRESLNALKLALPSVEEQEHISRILTRATTRIDALVEKTERSIELLKEHRSALITAAVTGQIDLRATVAAESQTDLRKTA